MPIIRATEPGALAPLQAVLTRTGQLPATMLPDMLAGLPQDDRARCG